MSKLVKIILILLLVTLVILISFYLIGSFKPKGAGIFVDTAPISDVYINGNLVGTTPYESIQNPGEITVKLVPQDSGLIDFETKVNLVSNIRTVVRREFAESEEKSAGEIDSFEKVGGKEASVSIVTIPNAAEISVDGQVRGFAPYKINSIMPGEHALVISANGYKERSLTINAYKGYKLTVVVKLATGEEILEQVPASNEANLKIVKIKISETPNNFLRVRKDPSTSSSEVARVSSGSTFRLIEEDKTTGWYKIEYEEGKEGWVSNEYSTKVEE